MKKTFALYLSLILSISGFTIPVDQQTAKTLAIAFYSNQLHSAHSDIHVKQVIPYTLEGITTFYTFIFQDGGFVMVAADDASIPVLAYSTTGTTPEQIVHPALADWLDSYSHAILEIQEKNLDNNNTRTAWDDILAGRFPKTTLDVQPLLNTTWDQGCYYNEYCPSDFGWGLCGHVPVGCVATAMAQIMKYHNFPSQGVMSHTFNHATYGQQSANFNSTTYHWESMPNSINDSNEAVATLMYHAGVSVNMNYGFSSSGANIHDVPHALSQYFNYHPDIETLYKMDFPNIEDWKQTLRDELNQLRPVFYAGESSGSGGHAFICDGYQLSTDMFHFNWGWSGSYDGYFSIGALNPGGDFNQENIIFRNIRPYNPNLIVRISDTLNNQVISVGSTVPITAEVLTGHATQLSLYIDEVLLSSVNNSNTISYDWSTTTSDMGTHEVKAVALNSSDTVIYRMIVNIGEWVTQNTGFQTAFRGIDYIHALTEQVVWATANDGLNYTAPVQEFTRTVDGGNTWVPGIVNDATGLSNAMIFALNADTAYIPMYRVSGSNPMGIYVTFDAGITWNHQSSASFSDMESFPNCVHFFNINDGWCMGDPINDEFEIYTTTNGGNTWMLVPGVNIPAPLPFEVAIVGYYSAIHDTIWFGTNKSRVYKSIDKGYHWTVSTSFLNKKYIFPCFRNGLHGLVQDRGPNTTGAICETFDGGETWCNVPTTGPLLKSDIKYVPGTANTWVSTGISSGASGASYSFDGGHTWQTFIGTETAPFITTSWINTHCGWAGSYNHSATKGGMYKFIGDIDQIYTSPSNLRSTLTGRHVLLTWDAPVMNTQLLGCQIYRDEKLLNLFLTTNLFFQDLNVAPGQYNYCVKAVYSNSTSKPVCLLVNVMTGVEEEFNLPVRIYPNPAHDVLFIENQQALQSLKIVGMTGQTVLEVKHPQKSERIDIAAFPRGIYAILVDTGNGLLTYRIVLK